MNLFFKSLEYELYMHWLVASPILTAPRAHLLVHPQNSCGLAEYHTK